MNYYDYRSYFNQLIESNSDILDKLTEIGREIINIKEIIQGGITLIAALIVVVIAIKVFFE